MEPKISHRRHRRYNGRVIEKLINHLLINSFIIIIIIIMTRRRLWSVATTLHDVHAPLHSALGHVCSVTNLLYPCVFRGRPGGLRVQFIPAQWPAFIAKTCFRAWCAGTLVSTIQSGYVPEQCMTFLVDYDIVDSIVP